MQYGHGIRVLVCGGRDFCNRGLIYSTLDELHNGERGPIRVVIHGNAYGADCLGGVWAIVNKIKEWPVAAEWSKYGKAAGPKRNKKMIGMGIELVVAFPGGRGTKNMVKIAKAAGVEVLEVQ